MKKQSILKKKRFHLLKRNLYQNGKAENKPMVTGGLVINKINLEILTKKAHVMVSSTDQIHPFCRILCFNSRKIKSKGK